MSYKTITVSKGTMLYRTPEHPKGGEEVEWFSQDPESSRIYSPDGRVSEYKTARDLVLLDVWTPETWGWLYTTFPASKYDLDMYSGRGTHYVTEIDRTNDFVKLFYDPMPAPFTGGTLEPKRQSGNVYMNAQSPMDYHVLKWRGLTWGPHHGEYKRYSSLLWDSVFVDLVRQKLPAEVDGLYAPILPAPNHLIPHLGLRKAFHDEIVVFPPIGPKVALVKQGGRRKTTKRRSRFNKQMRLTRRNAVHLKR
jgi:hypothetical protein